MAVEVIKGFEQLTEPLSGCAVAIGNFDGVHLGHQRILATARLCADEENLPVVAVTFDPPPLRLLAPDKAPPALMQLAQKTDALGQAGADKVLLIQTTMELLGMDPEPFVRDLLVERLRPRHVAEGQNFAFGRNRAGTVDVLRQLGQRYGFGVHVPQSQTVELADGQVVIVSSSLIRRFIADGDVDNAARCLGRPYAMLGRVVPGSGIGRTLSYPTANLDCGGQLLPGDGVYAGWATVDGRRHLAAMSVGTRPTFDGRATVVEAHLLDAPGDLYGKSAQLQFVAYLRPQERFASAEALCRQMERDVERVRQTLAQQ